MRLAYKTGLLLLCNRSLPYSICWVQYRYFQNDILCIGSIIHLPNHEGFATNERS